MEPENMQSSVTSADGTRIALETEGKGPSVILVEPALRYRGFSAFGGLIPLLARDFTVVSYDRRGRGESGDTLPYSPEREVEDLKAITSEVGGAHVYGYSSGALLALHAAASGVPVEGLALLEPPLPEDDAPRPDSLTVELTELTADGRNGDAVEHFQRSIGVPDEFLSGMRSTPEWAKMESVAHTLVYDCLISDATHTSLLGSIETPTLVLDSEGSSDSLIVWAAQVAGQLSHGSHRSLSGEWHTVPDEVLAPVLADFFGSA